MKHRSYLLLVKPSDFLPLTVNLRNLGIRGVEPKTTYVLTLQRPTDVKKPADGSIETITANGVPFHMVHVEGGTFQMGSNERDADIEEKPRLRHPPCSHEAAQ